MRPPLRRRKHSGNVLLQDGMGGLHVRCGIDAVRDLHRLLGAPGEDDNDRCNTGSPAPDCFDGGAFPRTSVV